MSYDTRSRTSIGPADHPACDLSYKVKGFKSGKLKCGWTCLNSEIFLGTVSRDIQQFPIGNFSRQSWFWASKECDRNEKTIIFKPIHFFGSGVKD